MLGESQAEGHEIQVKDIPVDDCDQRTGEGVFIVERAGGGVIWRLFTSQDRNGRGLGQWRFYPEKN